MKKRIISFALVLAMILSMTTVVFANEWESEIDTLGVAVVNGTYYPTVQAAVDAANGAVVKLLEDSAEEVTANGDLYLDLNGYSLKSLKISGKLYGMDTATDKYVDSGAKIETVEGAYEPYYKSAANKRYMAVKDGNALSFHRFMFNITYINLAPTTVGFGYRAEFKADETLQAQVKTIGYSLWLTEDVVVSRSMEGFKETMTLRLYNYDVNGYGEKPVNAKVFVEMKDGVVFNGNIYSYSMRTMLEMVDETFGNLTVVQKRAVNAMCKKFEAVNAWNIPQILTWTEEK